MVHLLGVIFLQVVFTFFTLSFSFPLLIGDDVWFTSTRLKVLAQYKMCTLIKPCFFVCVNNLPIINRYWGKVALINQPQYLEIMQVEGRFDGGPSKLTS
jgi:hypothetical protein